MSKAEKITVYVMQPYWQAAKRLAAGQPRQFKTREEAERAGERAARTQAGAVVYSMTGEPEFEAWSEPEVLARMGVVPG